MHGGDDRLGKTFGKTYGGDDRLGKTLGKTLGKPWGNLGETHLENLGKTVVNTTNL